MTITLPSLAIPLILSILCSWGLYWWMDLRSGDDALGIGCMLWLLFSVIASLALFLAWALASLWGAST